MKKVCCFIALILTFFLFINLDKEIVLKSNLLEENSTKIEKQSIYKLEKDEVVFSNPSQKTIYLTFDDGPSYLTNQILDILEEAEVPATFFVVGSNIYKYQEIVKRAYIDGHTIAIHSDSHNYGYVYSSLDNYLNDLMTIRRKVYNIIKEYPRIVRLPGGASNTISKNFKEGIMTEITNWLDNNDYYYFDWNIDSLDASGKASKESIYNSVISNLKSGNNIILMHDSSTKQATVEALPLIIEYAKKNGYTFAKITKNTETYHHKIRN